MEISFFSSPTAPRPIRTVLGEISYEMLGVTDAHNHVWIDPIPGADSAAPVLNQYGKIRDELLSYRSAGGESLMDCQPGGCGRNANKLAQLSRESSVNIVACTGFHRKKYYSPDHIFFSLSINETAKFLIRELTSAMDETRNQPKPIRAGFIKLALESMWNDTPQAALEGAAVAAHETGALVEIHTEKGALAGKVVVYFEDHGVDPKQLVLCHMDKRPDPGLHMELARYGALLEYDTFYRAKYEPETRLWPLIQSMVEAGLSHHIALATDMAEAKMYKNIGGGPGLASLPTEIRLKLAKIGVLDNSIRQMLGGNIARRLAGLD